MVRLAMFATVLLGLGMLCDARQKAVAHGLSKDMGKSLTKIASRFLSKSDIQVMVDLSAPKDVFIVEIDKLEKEIIKECHDESDSFKEWFQSKQDDLYTDSVQLESLKGHESDAVVEVLQLQSQLNDAQGDQSDLQAELDAAQKDLQSYQQQLQEATVQRQKARVQNWAVIKQHMDAMAKLQGLRNLVDKIDVSTKEVVAKELAKVQRVNFLNSKHGSKINELIASVKAELSKAMGKSPQDKAEIKKTLLDMIDGAMQGVQNSVTLYQSEEDSAQHKFDNEVKPSLDQMISQTEDRIANVQSQLADVIADVGTIQSDLQQAQEDLAQTQTQISTLQGLIQTLEAQIQQGTDAHNSKQDKCKVDLDALENIRQYVVEHVDGATPGNNCHPESPDCPRCLYDGHCSQGQICLDEGVCGVPQTTPAPQVQYATLISDVVGPSSGRRVDVGIIPQSAFNRDDFTYVFKYQQLESSESAWTNLFSVVSNGDGRAFPNQAALFVSGNQLELDICDNSLEWSQNYWYRNFFLDQVELNKWNAIAFVISSSSKTVTLAHRDSAGKIKTQSYANFHGNPQKFADTGIYLNSPGYAPLQANFNDFRRYEYALTGEEIQTAFNELFA